MAKRWIAFLLALVMLLSLMTGCGMTKETEQEEVPIVEDKGSPARTADKDGPTPISAAESYSPNENDSQNTKGTEGAVPASENNPYIDENNALTEPFDVVYPEVFESGEVEYSDETVLVKFKPGFDGKVTADMTASGIGKLEELFTIESGKWYKGYLTEGTNAEEAMAKIRALDGVLVAEYNFQYETFGKFYDGASEIDGSVNGNERSYEQWLLKSCGLQDAWKYQDHNKLPMAGEGTVVAVIDTGVDFNHEDLKNNMWINTKEVPNNGIDDDGNGYIDDYYGVDIVNGKGSGDDDNGHGTHVAGIVAAANNKIGVVGVAYNAKIMTVKAGNASGYFLQSDIAKAIKYAAENGADVINMSFGGSASTIAVQDALEYAYTTCVLVAAAGNDGLPNEDYPGNILQVLPNYPAAFKFVLGVMSVDSNGVESSFSNYDGIGYTSTEYEVYAPGSSILSTIPGDKYASWSGTSMAAPVVSGLAAMLRANFSDPNTYPTKFIYGQIAATGDVTATCINPKTHGRHNLPQVIDVYNALTELPKPELGFSDYTLFDTESFAEGNNGDGVLDAGETIALGFTINNRWGMSKDTVVTVNAMSQGGIPNPYVTFSTELNGDYGSSASIDYGSVGTYSQQDAGRIYTNDAFTGWDHPFYVKVTKDCPNDMLITLNLSISAKNGLDEKDTADYISGSTMTLEVRRGIVITGAITEDQTWTADNYYIIPNSAMIAKGVTVTVEPGTQIQFWSNDPKDAYADTAIAYLKVDGKLLCQGTQEEHIAMFPSELMSQYRVELQGSGYIELKYCDVVNPYFNGYNVDRIYGCEFTQNYKGLNYYRYLDGATVKYGSESSYVSASSPIQYSAFYKLGSDYYYTFYNAQVGSCDHCIFVDSGIQFNGATTNCVFYGNNNFWDSDSSGGTSSYTLGEPNVGYVDQAVYDPNTGHTYLRCIGTNEKQAETLAKVLGGYPASLETRKEMAFVQSAYQCGTQYQDERGNTYTDRCPYAVGLYKDGTDYRWASGAEVDPSFEVDDLRYRAGKYAVLNGDKFSMNADVQYYLIEIPDPVFVDDIGLETGYVSLDLEEAYQIIAAPQRDPGEDLIYESKNTEVATVDENGLVTPVSQGTADIYVYAPDKSSFSVMQVEVVEAVALTGLTLTAPAETLAVGSTMRLTTTLTPTNTTKRTVTYTSSDEAIATVDAKGVVTGVAPGNVTITAKDKSGSFTDTVELTVVIPATGITLNGGEDFFCTTASATDSIPVTLTPANTTQTELLWETSNPEVAYVDEAGDLIRIGTGNATLRATVKGTDLYDEIIVAVSDTEPTVYVEEMQEIYYSNKYYELARLSDGTVMVWGNDIKQPLALTLSGKHIVDMAAEWSNNLYLLDDTGAVYHTYFYGSASVTLPQEPLMTGVARLSETSGFRNSYPYYVYAITNDGGLWQLYGSNAPQQMNAEQVTTAVTAYYTCGVTYLTQNGSLYYLKDANSMPELLDTGITALYSNQYNSSDFYAEKGAQVYKGYMGSSSVSYPDETYSRAGNHYMVSYYGNFQCYIESGVLYVIGDNNCGQLGLGHTNSVSTFTPVPGIENVQKVFALYNTTYVQTTDGKLYAMGQNNEGQLADFTTANSSVPKRIYFGVVENEGGFTLEGANLTDTVLTESALTLDFSEALLSGGSFGGITLKNSSGGMVSIKKDLHLDKLIIRPLAELTAGEIYTLTLPAGGVTNRFSISCQAETLTFTYQPGEQQEQLTEQQVEEPQVEEQPETKPETVILTNQRHYWTVEEAQQIWDEYSETYNLNFQGNAVLNRFNETNVERWLRIQGNSYNNYTRIPLGGNYWGTTNEDLINKQLVDFDDYQSLADLDPTGYLTSAPEDVWPFVVKAGLKTEAGEVSIVGNETVTFCVDFNRDMDTSIPLQVRFGSTYPYADYEVSGQWITPRHWEGTTTLTTLIENGVQCWSIANGRSADEMHLKLYKDWGRFTFGIDTTQALAMTMQASATAEGINLTWYQDDFETLAGYNVYRSTSEDGLYTRLNKTILPADTKTFFDENIEPGQLYYYNFTVVKTDMSESTPSGKVSVRAYDTMAPNIYHTPVYTAFTGNKIGISATVTDNVVVQSAKVFYRVAGTEEWKSLTMTASNDKYTAFIPVADVTTAGVDYYIQAFDGVSYTYRGRADDPFNITVQYKPDANALGDVDGDGAITVNDALMILQATNDLLNLTPEQFARADINGDGELSAREALCVIQYVNGKITHIAL